MRLPPWAIQAIREGVADVARKASDPETINRVREQAAELMRDLPENASRGLDAMLKTASERAREALDQGRESIRRWAHPEGDLAVTCHNASGELFSPLGTGVPVSDHVLAAGYDLLRGDVLRDHRREGIDRALARFLGLDDHALLVANQFDGAVAALAELARQRTLVLHRSQAIGLPSGTPLPDLFEGLPLKECGSVQGLQAKDFEGLENACVLLADDGQHPVTPLALSDPGTVTVAILPVGTLGRPLAELPDAVELLRQGIDLVVLAAGPVIGGPSAGILAGKASLIESLKRSTRWQTLLASDAVAAMTLAALDDPHASPLAQLIETSEENLRSRAERLATRLTADPAIASCHITDAAASLIREARWHFPSRQLRLRHRRFKPDDWAEKLKRSSPAVLAAVDGDDLVLDLRWVAPANDAAVAKALESEPERGDEASSEAGQSAAGESAAGESAAGEGSEPSRQAD